MYVAVKKVRGQARENKPRQAAVSGRVGFRHIQDYVLKKKGTTWVV
jgi:hypothetical protein